MKSTQINNLISQLEESVLIYPVTPGKTTMMKMSWNQFNSSVWIYSVCCLFPGFSRFSEIKR